MEALMDITFDKKTAQFLRNFYLRFNVFTEGFSFFIVVPIILFYVWANIQLKDEQLLLFFKLVPPAFVFGIAFVMVNNWIAVLPIIRYFNKLLRNEEIPDEMYAKAKKRLYNLPVIHSIGAFFRWLILLANAIVPFSLISDASTPQIVNMWMGAGLCSILGIASYFAITEIMVQNIINKGVFPKKLEFERPPRVTLRQRLTGLSVSSVLLTLSVMVTFFYITVEMNRIATPIMYVRIGVMGLMAIVVGIFSPFLVIKTLRDKINVVVEFLGRIGNGDLVSSAGDVPVQDEISEIIHEVDEMKDSLRSARDQLLDMNINLEKKVAERTEELEAAMNELEAMNENLVRVNRELEDNEMTRKKDLTLAASLQSSFLLNRQPAYARFDIATLYQPWSEVSGDFFDFYEDCAELRGAGLFDVSGHGVSSGLLTLLAKSIITRNFNSHRTENLSVIMEHVNRDLIAEIGKIDNYVTGILLRFAEDHVEYVNCAHPDIVFRSGSSGRVGRILDRMGDNYRSLVLGVEGIDQPFPSVSLKLGKGDCLFLYTDCIIETKDEEGNFYDEARIMDAMKRAPGGSAQAVLDFIMKDFSAFRGKTQVKDDLTVICIMAK
jgi:serine phosphatase RsbU (regulator of sigma subunit)